MLNVLGILNEFSNTSQKLAIIFMPFYYLIKNFITNQNLSHHKSTIYYDSRVLTARLKDLYFKQNTLLKLIKDKYVSERSEYEIRCFLSRFY